MSNRERFIRTMRYEHVDRRPLHLVGAWPDTLERWHREGLPRGADVHEGLKDEVLRVVNISPTTGVYPPFETRVIQQTDTWRICVDSYGRTVREFLDHTSMPEWLEFPVKGPDDLKRVLNEHYSIENLDERFPADWEQKARNAVESGAVVLIDGGCYYWTLRSLTGVETASLLFYDAPELVDELFERYCAVVMEGIRRASRLVPIDVIGFGEDIAFKNGPLVSPAMFREHLLPRYRKVMELAHSVGVELTWCDSDGDLRLLIPAYMEVGINCFAPCEVAAEMDPVELRKTFGRELRMIGGVDKRAVARGREAIRAEIAHLRPLIEEGGYIPAIDHSVSSDISLDNYRYFLDVLRDALAFS